MPSQNFGWLLRYHGRPAKINRPRWLYVLEDWRRELKRRCHALRYDWIQSFMSWRASAFFGDCELFLQLRRTILRRFHPLRPQEKLHQLVLANLTGGARHLDQFFD